MTRSPIGWSRCRFSSKKNLETSFDFTICVVTPFNIVKVRMVPGNYPEGEIERRCDKQMPLAEKASRADYVISNAGSLDFLKRQVVQLIEQIAHPLN